MASLSINLDVHFSRLGNVVYYRIGGRLVSIAYLDRKVFVDMWDEKVKTITRAETVEQ